MLVDPPIIFGRPKIIRDLSFIIGGGWVENGGSTKNLRCLRRGLRKISSPERGLKNKRQYHKGGGSTKENFDSWMGVYEIF